MRNYQKHKYRAKPKKVDNIHFHSSKEANYYGQLKMLQKAGEIDFFLQQVPFILPGGIKYKLDFMEFWKDGTIKYVDIKGYMTPVSKIKIKQVEDLYPIKIDIK